MARKSKARSARSRKKKVSRKSRGPKAAFLTQGIGIFSSIPFSQKWRDKFNEGLGVPLPTMVVKDGLGYDQTALETALNELNQSEEIGLIVTMGGVVTLRQALEDPGGATQYFISLFGGRKRVPSPNSEYFLGGVSLESYRHNPARVRRIRNKVAISDKKEICLLSNKNSSMANTEKRAWGGRIAKADIDPATADPLAEYKTAFQAIASFTNPPVKAVVVSADPFYLETGPDLIRAANTWVQGGDRVVCYPLQDYKTLSPAPMQGKRLFFGPNLAEAYKKLGQKARAILDSNIQPVGSLEDATQGDTD